MAEPKLKLTRSGEFFGQEQSSKFPFPPPILDKFMALTAIRGTTILVPGATEKEIQDMVAFMGKNLAQNADTKQSLKRLENKSDLRRMLRLLFEEGFITGVDPDDDDLQEDKIDRLIDKTPQSMRDELEDIRGF